MKSTIKVLGLMLMVSNSYAGQCDFAFEKEFYDFNINSVSRNHEEMIINRLIEQGYNETSPEQANILIKGFSTVCDNAEYINTTRICTKTIASIKYLFKNEYPGRKGLTNSAYGYKSEIPYLVRSAKNELVESRYFVGSDWSLFGANDDKAMARMIKKIPKCKAE